MVCNFNLCGHGMKVGTTKEGKHVDKMNYVHSV